jgi:hypothetical protein
MSRVADLCRRIESLERKKVHVVLVKALSTYDTDVETFAGALSSSATGAETVERVFGPQSAATLRGKLRDSAHKVARLASNLAKRIRANPAYVGKNEAGDAISDLKGLAPAAARMVADAWAKAMADRCELLRARIAVAELAGAGSGSELRRELDRLQSARLPSLHAEVQEVVEFFARADSAVAKVGASKRLSSFIEDATRGSASARDLDDSEVRAFLDAHRLWQRLTVKLT